MTAPNHPHSITIEQNPNRVKVTFNGTVIADTGNALVLREGPLSPAHYIPREDVTMASLQRTTHSTHCPFKGDASYFTVSAAGKTVENAVWSYESPLQAVADIKDYLAFYPDKMDAIQEIPQAS